MSELFQRIFALSTKKEPTPEESIAMIQFTGLIAEMMVVAAELGIADLLKNGPQPVTQLAETTGTNTDALYRTLRALAGFGIFSEKDDQSFELTPLAECLTTDAPNSVRSFMVSAGLRYKAWNSLLHSVKTGETAFNHVFGMEVFKYLHLPENRDLAGHFSRNFLTAWQMIYSGVVTAYDFSRYHKIVDVGGNHGMLLESIIRTYPNTQGILFDLPPVAEATRGRFAQVGLSDRCETVGGSFFESVVGGGDLYTLSQVIHDWTDKESISILSNCRKAMGENSRLLVIEQLMHSGNAPSVGKIMDVEMMVMTGGRERTEEQYADLLQQSGFKVSDVVKTDRLILMEGTPVSN